MNETLKSLLDIYTRQIRKSVESVVLLHADRIKTNIDSAYSWLKNHLQSDELPYPQNSDNLTSNLSLLDNWKITDSIGVDSGTSLIRILCDPTITTPTTHITDDNRGWSMTKSVSISMFPNVESVELGCSEAINVDIISGSSNILTRLSMPYVETINASNFRGILNGCPNIEEFNVPSLKTFYVKGWERNTGLGPMKGTKIMEFPSLQSAYTSGNTEPLFRFTECEILKFPKISEIQYIGNAIWVGKCDKLKELYLPKLTKLNSAAGWPHVCANNPVLEKVVFGIPSDRMFNLCNGNTYPGEELKNCPNLIDVVFNGEYDEQGELIKKTDKNIYFDAWVPSDDVLNEKSSIINQNIREHIVPTLAQSNRVMRFHTNMYNILEEETKAAIENKGWTISVYTPSS